MVFNDLWFHLCGFLEYERSRVCHRGNGHAFQRRTDEACRRAAALSRPWQTIVGASDALGLFCFLPVPDHVVRKSSRGDYLVSPPHARNVGWDSARRCCPPFRAAVFVSAFKKTQAQSGKAGNCRRADTSDETGRSVMDDWAGLYEGTLSC